MLGGPSVVGIEKLEAENLLDSFDSIGDATTTSENCSLKETYHDDQTYLLPTTEHASEAFREKEVGSYIGRFTNLLYTLPTVLYKCLGLLIPSFCLRSKGPHPSSSRLMKSTAWLDGLRGVSALLVVVHHHSGLWYIALWDDNLPGPIAQFFQIPWIRTVWYAGYLYVAIFFVISGYSLSYRPLSLLRDERTVPFLDSLSSSAFRRGFRLFVPPTIISFFVMLTVQIGWMYDGDERPASATTFSGNIWLWIKDAVAMFDPFRPMPGLADDDRYYPNYNHHLWTIPVEFQGSLAVFMILLVTAKASSAARTSIVTFIIGYCFLRRYLYHVTFVAGILLAELNFAYEQRQKTDKGSARRRRLQEFTAFLALVAAWSMALSEDRLTRLAAILIVASVNYSATLQMLFTTSFAQYLGRISFCLYMVHGPVILCLTNKLTEAIGLYIRTTEDVDPTFILTTLLTGAVTLPLTFWIADVATRCVDEKSVVLARWVWERIATSHVGLAIPEV